MKLILKNGKEFEGKIYKQLEDSIKFTYLRMMPHNNSTCGLDETRSHTRDFSHGMNFQHIILMQ